METSKTNPHNKNSKLYFVYKTNPKASTFEEEKLSMSHKIHSGEFIIFLLPIKLTSILIRICSAKIILSKNPIGKTLR